MNKILLLVFFLSFAATVNAMEACPISFGTDNYLDKVSQKITDSGSCFEASEIADACALGASGDVFTVGTAIERCEKDMPVLSKEDASMYKTLNDKCTDKYSKLDGTMYMSMNAFCHLQVTRLFLELSTSEE